MFRTALVGFQIILAAFGVAGDLCGQDAKSIREGEAVGEESNPQAGDRTAGGLDPAALSDGPNPKDDDPLEMLSRDKYSRRQQATLEMWRQREASRDQVQAATHHPDPEVAGRARWILRQWRRGSLPDTPPEISRLLQHADGPLAIERLLENGQFSAVLVAFEESLGTADREAIEKRISSAMLRRFPMYVHQALATDSLQDLLKLVDLVANSNEMAICRIQLMRQMGIDVEAESLLPTSAADWPPIQRQRAAALALLTLGRIDQAIEVARQSIDEDLLHRCRMIGGQWSEAARDSMAQARKAEPGSYEHARFWCLTLISADRAGDQEKFDQAVEALSPAGSVADDAAAELRWKCLASHGELDAAFAILDQINPAASALVAIDAARTGHAFDTLGFPLQRVDLEISEWVDEAIEVQRREENDVTPQVRQLLALMQSLISVGRHDVAWYVARRLCESDVRISSLRLREWVVSTLTTTKRSDWVVPLAVVEGQKTLSPQSQSAIASTLSYADSFTLEVVLKGLEKLMSDKPLEQQLEAAYQLLDGEIPEGFESRDDFRKLYDYVTQPLPNRRLRGGEMSRPRMLANLQIVKLFARHGQSDLAAECLQRLTQLGDLDALFFLAEQELDGGRAPNADELFQTIYRLIESQGRSATRTDSGEDAALAVKALIGMWIVARRSGDQQRSDDLEREIRLALCSPSTKLRSAVADYLGQRGHVLLALEAYEVLLPMTVFGTEQRTGLYDVARNYAMLAKRTNPAEASRWFDLAVGGTLDSMNFRPGAYVTLPLYVRRWALEAAIQRRDADDVRRHLRRILKLDPMDIDFAERLLPEMRKSGMEELADEAFGQIMDNGLRYTQSFPFDAMSCNNLAWVAAMNHKRLDDALRLSNMAVYVEPDSAIYRDTLAEVLFQLDRKREALQLEQACLLDDPTQWHLHQQIEKYKAAVVGEVPGAG